MVDKRSLHHHWRSTQRVKNWHIFFLLILSVGFSAWALRQNSLGLEPKVTAVIAADEAGTGIEEAVQDLGNYITSHMNANLENPVQLAASYNRAVQDELERAQATSNGSVYRQAQAECEVRSVPLSVRAQCIQDYVLNNASPGQDPATELVFPDRALYTYDFVSPAWSPDRAGFAVLLSASLVVLWGARLIAGKIVERILHSHQ
jgi:hypothetical protein